MNPQQLARRLIPLRRRCNRSTSFLQTTTRTNSGGGFLGGSHSEPYYRNNNHKSFQQQQQQPPPKSLRTKLRHCQSIPMLFRHMETNNNDYETAEEEIIKPFHYAFFWERAAELAQRRKAHQFLEMDVPRYQHMMMERTLPTIPEMNAQAVAQMAEGMAKLSLRFQQLNAKRLVPQRFLFDCTPWKAMEKRCLEIYHVMPFVQCYNILWSMTKCHWKSPAVMDRFAHRIVHQLPPDEWTARGTSILLWSYAKSQQKHEILCEALSNDAVTKLRDFRTQELSMLVWSLATLQFEPAKHTVFAAVSTSENVRVKLPHFKPQELSITLWSYAKLGYHHRRDNKDDDTAAAAASEFYNALIHEIRPKLPLFRTQELSNIVWACATLQHSPSTELFHAMMPIMVQKLKQFKNSELTIVLWSYAKMGINKEDSNEPFFRTILAELIHRRLPRLQSQELSNLIWSCATLGYTNPELFDKISPYVLNKLSTLDKSSSLDPNTSSSSLRTRDTYTAQALSNTLWSYATALGPKTSSDFIRALIREIPTQLSYFSSQGLSNTLWALATMEHDVPSDEEFWELIQPVIIQKLPSFNAQELSNTAWALATLQDDDDDDVLRSRKELLLTAMIPHIIQKLPTFRTQHLANTIWSLATMNIRQDEEILDRISRQVVQKANRLSKVELSIILWSLATLDYHDHKLWDALLPYCIEQMPTFGAQNLSNTVWSYATTNYSSNEELFQAASMRLQQLLEDDASILPQELSNTLWSFATLQEPLHVADAAVRHMTQNVSQYTSQGLSNCLWSLALLHHAPSTNEMEILLDEATLKLESFQNQEVINILWSLAVLNYHQDRTTPFLRQVQQRYDETNASVDCCFAIVELKQLHQVFLWLTREQESEQQQQAPEDNDELLVVLQQLQPLMEQCRHEFEIIQTQNTSRFQTDIATTLQSMGYSVKEEQICSETGYSIDIIVSKEGETEEVAMEADGPSHFVSSLDQPTGATVLKRRQLSSSRPLVSISHWEWQECSTDDDRREQLLQEKLKPYFES